MKDVIYLLFHLLTTLAKLIRPGGIRTVIAENLLLKQQLRIHSRSRQRAPNLSTQDRALLGFMSLFLSPRRIGHAAIIIRPSTLLSFHNALKKRKYRLLYSPGGGRKPGPKGPSKETIHTIIEMKRRNRDMDALVLRSRSTWLLASSSTRMLYGEFSPPTTNQIPAITALPG